MTTTFFSVPHSDVTRTVSFIVDTNFSTNEFIESWNDPFHGHVFSIESEQDNHVTVLNKSTEPMILIANNPYSGAYLVGYWGSNEMQKMDVDVLMKGNIQSHSYFIAFEDHPVFKFTAYLHRKKSTQPYYVREETIALPKGVYCGIGHVAATLNQNITMRGERNGYIIHFVTRNGKLCIEASHKQPEPSFVEVIPLHYGLGLTEQDVVRLRTKERLDFPYAPCCII